MFELKNLTYCYGKTKALDNISLTIGDGVFLAVIGPAGSGKSTLLKHLNGLLKPTEGSISINVGNKDNNKISRHVGLVFQSPEDQLFEDTVLKDVMFGPSCFKLPDPGERARAALSQVGISEELFYRHPLSLSGGERRLAAIAGVLAFDPEVLVLDEPAAGLDYVTKKRLFGLLKSLNRNGKTIVFSSHNMDDVAEYASDVLQLQDGKVLAYGSPRSVLKDTSAQLVACTLNQHGIPISGNAITLDELEYQIEKVPAHC